MKKIFVIASLLCFISTFGQNNDNRLFEFGVTAGFNYGSNGDLSEDLTNTNFSSSEKTGYHAGVYFCFNLKNSYLRPEVLYTKTKSEYNSDEFDVTKIDVPVLYGFYVFKPVSIFLGPSFQYTVDNGLENIDTNTIDIENDFAVNGQIGLAVHLGSQIRLDARYETGLTDNIASIRDMSANQIGEIDAKPNQIILSISLQL